MDKTELIKTCEYLADRLTNRLFSKFRDTSEIRLIFDRFDVPFSLKTATRARRQGALDPVNYRITDSRYIAKVRKKLIAHAKIKV